MHRPPAVLILAMQATLLRYPFYRLRSLQAATERSAPVKLGCIGLLSPFAKNCSSSQMGSLLSATAKSPPKTDTLQVETSIRSPPLAKFCDPLDLSVTVDAEQLKKMTRSETTGNWHVELEVDVAHLQARYTLVDVDVDMQTKEHRLLIPSSAFLEVMKAPVVTVDSICNICAIHARLYGDRTRSEPLALVTVVLDVSRNGYNAGSELSGIIRRVYGVADASSANGCAT